MAALHSVKEYDTLSMTTGTKMLIVRCLPVIFSFWYSSYL